jgi:energy-converting hydrogenase Eha subunit A
VSDAGELLGSFLPSLIIAVSVSAAFAIGWLSGRLVRRSARATQIMRTGVIALSVAAAVFFVRTHSSRYALLLPVAFTAGAFAAGRRRFAPPVFPDRR